MSALCTHHPVRTYVLAYILCFSFKQGAAGRLSHPIDRTGLDRVGRVTSQAYPPFFSGGLDGNLGREGHLDTTYLFSFLLYLLTYSPARVGRELVERRIHTFCVYMYIGFWLVRRHA